MVVPAYALQSIPDTIVDELSENERRLECWETTKRRPLFL